MSLAFDKFRYLLLFSFAAITMLTVVWYLINKNTINLTFNYVNTVFFLIYLFWVCLSVFYDNDLLYIFQDSVGFIFYLAYPPLAFILIRFASKFFYDNLICYIGLAVSALHAIMYGLYYIVMGLGELRYDKLILFNLGLTKFGFTGRLGASEGLLRIDLGLGPLLLIPFTMSVNKVLNAKKMSGCKSQTSLALLITLGAVLDGHRSLLITMIFALVLLIIFKIEFKQVTFHRFIVLMFAVVLGITALISFFSITGIFDFSLFYDRMSTLFVFDQNDISNQERFGQIPALLQKISERPLLGNGFGSYAEILRNEERPFMYEVDYLAILMKLGIVGTVLYIGAYVAVLIKGYGALRKNFDSAAPYVSAGAAYLFYMGTNGGFGMSLFSTLLHVMVMLGITNSLKNQCSSHKPILPHVV